MNAAKVIEIIGLNCGISAERIKPEYRFVADLGFDSLDVVELQLALESEFAVTLGNDEWESLDTVQEAIDYLAKVQAAQTPAVG